jgi:hypothetical protein
MIAIQQFHEWYDIMCIVRLFLRKARTTVIHIVNTVVCYTNGYRDDDDRDVCQQSVSHLREFVANQSLCWTIRDFDESCWDEWYYGAMVMRMVDINEEIARDVYFPTISFSVQFHDIVLIVSVHDMFEFWYQKSP